MYENIIKMERGQYVVDGHKKTYKPKMGPGANNLDSLNRPLPNLIVSEGSSIEKYSYEENKKQYERVSSRSLHALSDIVYCGGNIFVTTLNHVLIKMDNNFRPLSSRIFNCIGSMATDGKNIFLSADNSFMVLNTNLATLSQVGLFNKNAHDIIIYENTAYLLDNIVFPIFVFRIDIQNTEEIKIKERNQIEVVNGHLDAHCLKPELNQWLILSSYGIRSGNGQIIYIFPMLNGDCRAEQTIYHQGWHQRRNNDGNSQENEEGIQIKAMTSLSPVWAIILDDKYYLAEVKSDETMVSFSKTMFLDFSMQYSTSRSSSEYHIYYQVEPRDIKMIHQDDYLFIYYNSEYLIIIDTQGQPRIVFDGMFREIRISSRGVMNLTTY